MPTQLTVQILDEEAFHIIQSYVGGAEWTNEALNDSKLRGERAKFVFDRKASVAAAEAEVHAKGSSIALKITSIIFIIATAYALMVWDFGFGLNVLLIPFTIAPLAYVVYFFSAIFAKIYIRNRITHEKTQMKSRNRKN